MTGSVPQGKAANSQSAPAQPEDVRIELPPELAKAKVSLAQARGADSIKQAVEKVLQFDPADADALRRAGELYAAQRQPVEAAKAYARALRIRPDDDILLRRYIGLAARIGAHVDALSAARYWVTIVQERRGAAMRILAGLYGLLGKDVVSRRWAYEAARVQPVNTLPASGRERLRILILGTISSGGYTYRPEIEGLTTSEGHNNLSEMLDSDSITRIYFSLDALEEHPELIREAPEADIVYNSITDANRCEKMLNTAQWVCEQLGKPVFNPPLEVLATTREQNVERLEDAKGVLVPRSIPLGRLESEVSDSIREAIEEHGLSTPVIVRAAGYQNGRFMHRIDDPENTPVTLPEPMELYLLQYHDYSCTDERAPGETLYPKYRAFMVGGRLYPVHLRVGHEDDWNVHLPESQRTFEKYPWLYEDERAFIENPGQHLGGEYWKNLENALQRLELDYFGVDFAICTEPGHEGEVVIFEANASMRSFMADTAENTAEHAAARAVIEAAHARFCERAGSQPWDFQLPRGKARSAETGEPATAEQ